MNHLQQHNEVQDWHRSLSIHVPFYTKKDGIIHLLSEEEIIPGENLSKEDYYFLYNDIFGEVPSMRNKPKEY